MTLPNHMGSTSSSCASNNTKSPTANSEATVFLSFVDCWTRAERNMASFSSPRPKLLLLVGTEEELFLPPPVPTGDELRLRLERRLAIACAVGVRRRTHDAE